MENGNDDNNIDRFFDLYESNSKNFQKTFGILVGIGLFFLLTVIFPYFLNIYEQNEKKIQISNALDAIQQANVTIKKSIQEILHIKDVIKRLTKQATFVNGMVNNETKEFNKSVAEGDKILGTIGERSMLIKLNQIRNKTQYAQNSTLRFVLDQLKSMNEDISDYKKENYTLNQQLIAVQENIKNSKIRLIEANNTKTTLFNRLHDLTEQWKQIQTPFGNLPIEFTNLLAIFPISLASGFLLSKVFLSESINLRRFIHHLYKKREKRGDFIKNQQIYLVAPLWIDPANPNQNKTMQFSIFFLPFVIFVLSIFMIAYSWHYAPIAPFAAAADISKDIYFGLYVICFVIFIHSYWQIINDVRSYYNKLDNY